MAIEIVCILLNICIIYEPKSSTAECPGAGLVTDCTGGGGWIWARLIQILHVSPTLPSPTGGLCPMRRRKDDLDRVCCTGAVRFLPLRNATQGRDDTGIRLFGNFFFYNSDSSKLKGLERAVPDVHTNLSLNEQPVIQIFPAPSMKRERNNGLEYLFLSQRMTSLRSSDDAAV